MGIRQFSGKYLHDEDRLAFRVSTSDDREYRFLLTRRVARKLLAGSRSQAAELVALRHPGTDGHAVARFKQDALRQNVDLTQPFAPAAQQPLGEHALLVLDANHALDTETAPPLAVLRLRLASRREVVFRLPQESLERMLLLLDQLQQIAAWDLQPAAGSLSPPPPADTSGALH